MRRVADNAWIVFFLLGVLTVVAAPIQWRGQPPDPPSPEGTLGMSLDELDSRVPGISTFLASVSRQLGNFMFVSGALMAAVAAFPFRRGERWAWFAMWTAPILLALQFANSNFGNGWWADLGLIPVMVAGLLAPYRRFFPRREG